MTPVPANPVPARAPRNSNSAVKFIFFFIIALALGATILLLRQDQGDWTPPPEARLQKNPVQVNESTVARAADAIAQHVISKEFDVLISCMATSMEGFRFY